MVTSTLLSSLSKISAARDSSRAAVEFCCGEANPAERETRAAGGNRLLCRDANWLCLDSDRAAEFDFLACQCDSSRGPFIGLEGEHGGPFSWRFSVLHV